MAKRAMAAPQTLEGRVSKKKMTKAPLGERKGGKGEEAYKEPRRNMPATAHFCFGRIWRRKTIGRGTVRMMISVTKPVTETA